MAELKRLGTVSSQEWLKLRDLKVDHSYQRSILSPRNIAKIAANFNWEVFGVITVGRRVDGSLWVVDGQHRVLAATKHDELAEVPASVFDSSGPSHEAEVFHQIGANRVKVHAADRFKTLVTARSPVEVEIATWLDGRGLRVGRGTHHGYVTFPGRLLHSWNVDIESSKVAIDMQLRLLEMNEVLHCDIHDGLWWLLHNKVKLTEAHIDKIRTEGGRAVVVGQIRKLAVLAGTYITPPLSGKAILNLINRGRRFRLSVKE